MSDKTETLPELYDRLVACTSCGVRKFCTQVVPATGCLTNPLLMVVGEAPGQQEDEEGEPFVGAAGEILREALRATNVLNRNNTLITNVLKCRPPKNKFPTDESASICISNWLWREIEIASPKRLLLLGNVPLKYVGGLDGITKHRGQWYTVRGIRTMATYHPSFILRTDRTGMLHHRNTFESDIKEVAAEIKGIIGEQSESASAT